MSVEPPQPGQVFEKSGALMPSPRASAWPPVQTRTVIRKRPGRPSNDALVAEWVARIEGPEFRDLDSMHAKCRKLVWLEQQEPGGNPDIKPRQFARLVEQRRAAIRRWDKRHR